MFAIIKVLGTMLLLSIIVTGNVTAILFRLRFERLSGLWAKQFLVVVNTNSNAKIICNKKEERYGFKNWMLNVYVNLQN